MHRKGKIWCSILGYNYTTCHHGLTIFATVPRGVEESAKQQLVDDALRLATTKTIADVERSRGKPSSIATYYYTLMAWVKNYMTVLLILFGKSCPLLQDYERIRNTLVLVKRRNGIYLSRSNVANLILRLFTESRSVFSTITNEKDLDSNILPITNLGSTATIIANCQPIKGDDLPLALMSTNNQVKVKWIGMVIKMMDIWVSYQEIKIWHSRKETDNTGKRAKR